MEMENKFFWAFFRLLKDNLKEYDFNNENKFHIRLKAKEITKFLEKIFLKHNIILMKI